MASQKTTVYLDADDYRRLKRIAETRHCAPARLVREAVAEYAARHSPSSNAKRVGGFSSGGRSLSERADKLLDSIGKTR